MIESEAYKNPFTKRRNTSNQKLLAKLDAIVAKVATKSEGIRVARRPFVSARNPQRCDDNIIPTYPIALNIPLSVVDKSKSHCAIGKMKFTEVSSIKAQAISPPANKMMI